MTRRRLDLLAAAISDNLRWCATVCATSPTVGEDGTWTTAGAPHPLFPDLVTARPGVTTSAVLSRLAGRPCCTVKDSYVDLDLGSAGFAPLHDARWIGLRDLESVGPPEVGGWSRVVSPAGLARWSAAAGLPVPLPSHVGATAGTAVLVTQDGAVATTGFVATLGDGVVGVSNVWSRSPDAVWPTVVAALGSIAPGRAAVGYEHGTDLDEALTAGFEPLGPLRVWAKGV